MKSNLLLPLAMCALAAVPAMADITITSTGEAQAKLVSIPISEYAKGRKAIQTVVTDSATLRPGVSASFATPEFEAVNILSFTGNDRENETFFTAPGENVTVAISSTAPIDATFSGTPLLEGMENLEQQLAPVMQQYEQLAASNALTDEALEKIFTDYDNVIRQVIESDPSSLLATYAVTALQRPEAQTEMFARLAPAVKTNMLYPLAEAANTRATRTLEAEARQKALESGLAPAPDFSLPDLDGKKVSLEQFRGKWVILDFWGSWCRWCIKGFPALKEAYQKYGDKLAIIGIDCGDTPEVWKSAVERYQLPWVQVYNADAPDSIDKTYGIQGFPTKVIINPEGKIVNITTGEDPAFFEKLDAFINK